MTSECFVRVKELLTYKLITEFYIFVQQERLFKSFSLMSNVVKMSSASLFCRTRRINGAVFPMRSP